VTIVVDGFSGKKPTSSSFSSDEFRVKLLPNVWMKIAKDALPGVRLVLVVRDELYDKYGLADLPDPPIDLSPFPPDEASKLFFELCRFYRRAKRRSANSEEPLDVFAKAFVAVVGKQTWRPGAFRFWREQFSIFDAP
jgi:hypothetical protein